MKIITKEYNVFNYNELSAAAKENVKKWILDDPERNNTFYENCKEELTYLFPRSKLDLQYSLSYSQGDGLNVYGDLHYKDIIELWNPNITKHKKAMLAYFEYFLDDYITLPRNDNNYCYSILAISNSTLYAENIIDELKYRSVKNINKNAIHNFSKFLYDYFRDIENKMESAGYNYLYEISDDEITEICDNNNYMFLENGTIFY